MRSELVVVVLVLLGIVGTPSLRAADEVVSDRGTAGVTLKAGTLGYGVDVTFGLASEFNTRFGFNMFDYEPNVEDEQDEDGPEDIDLEISLQTIAALLDWHPWAESFRFTLGVVVNNNEVVLTADIGDTVEINDREYAISDLEGKITFDSVAPYLGLGYGNAVRGGRVHFAFDLGVMFQGEPEVSLTATASDGSQQARLQADLDAEKADLQSDLDPFTMYPVVSFGISFTF